MSFVNEFALLVVIAAPVVTVMTINLILAVAGGRGTRLFPLRAV